MRNQIVDPEADAFIVDRVFEGAAQVTAADPHSLAPRPNGIRVPCKFAVGADTNAYGEQ